MSQAQIDILEKSIKRFLAEYQAMFKQELKYGPANKNNYASVGRYNLNEKSGDVDQRYVV